MDRDLTANTGCEKGGIECRFSYLSGHQRRVICPSPRGVSRTAMTCTREQLTAWHFTISVIRQQCHVLSLKLMASHRQA